MALNWEALLSSSQLFSFLLYSVLLILAADMSRDTSLVLSYTTLNFCIRSCSIIWILYLSSYVYLFLDLCLLINSALASRSSVFSFSSDYLTILFYLSTIYAFYILLRAYSSRLASSMAIFCFSSESTFFSSIDCFFNLDYSSNNFLSSYLILSSYLFLFFVSSNSLSWMSLYLLSTIFYLSSKILFWFLNCIYKYSTSYLAFEAGR